ncbi:hypothetical protein [Flindersiella endophytica]
MAGESAVVHRALDGTRFRIEAPGEDLSRPFTSIAEVVLGGRLFEFTSGVARLGDDLRAAFGAGDFDEELRYRGGTLRLATRRTYDPQSKLVETPTLVVWRGERRALVTQVYGSSTAEVLAALRPLGIDEQEDGLALDVGDGAHFALPAFVLKEVPGLGLLEITVPGKRSQPGGGLTWDKLTNGRPYAVLAGDGVQTTVLPLAGTDLGRIPARLGKARIAVQEGVPAWTS